MMKKEIKITLAVVSGIIMIALAYYLISPIFITVEMNEASPMNDSAMDNSISENQSAEILYKGTFTASAHDVSGTAKIIESNGKRYLRFENFETINGPNLHIYLSADLSAKDYIDLGEIKATKGNVNYEIPEGTDLKKYKKVLVWCVPFRVLFSYSELG